MREDTWHVLALTEMRVQTSEAHYRIPDVCLMSDDWQFEPIAKSPPLLCVEILSWDDRMSEMYEKVEDYLRMGVGTVWLVDPRRRKVFCTDERGALVAMSDEPVVEGTAIRVVVAEMFRQLNRLEGVD